MHDAKWYRDRLKNIFKPLESFKKGKPNWLVPGWIPLGAITVLDGMPGAGKSTVMHSLTASLTSGKPFLNGMANDPANVIYLDAENPIGPITRANIENFGGDITRVKICDSFQLETNDPSQVMTFPSDLHLLEMGIALIKPILIVIDTFYNHLDRSLKGNNDQDVRAVLTPLSHIADRYQVSVVILRHLNKSSMGPAMYRGSGSIGINGVARAVVLCARDPMDPERSVLAPVKESFGKLPKSHYYWIEEDEVGYPKINWGAPCHYTADDLLGPSEQEEATENSDEAVFFLTNLLSAGPVGADEVWRLAAESGISRTALRRAKSKLDVKASKDGFKHGWVWNMNVGSSRQERLPFKDQSGF